MSKLVIKTATEDDFFTRGQQLATLADAGKSLPEEHTITFEDPLEMVRVLSAARIVSATDSKNVSGLYYVTVYPVKAGSQHGNP